MVKIEEYELQENEQWTNVVNTAENQRQIEIVVEEGLCNSPLLRAEASVFFYEQYLKQNNK